MKTKSNICLFVKAAGGVRQDLYPASLDESPQFDPGFALCLDSKRISEERALGNKQQTDGHSLTSQSHRLLLENTRRFIFAEHWISQAMEKNNNELILV